MPAPHTLYTSKLELLQLSATPFWLFASIARQELTLFEGANALCSYRCSSSIKPPSCQYGSGGTPFGLHRIAEKIGEGVPLGGIFRAREFTGEVYSNEVASSEALVTTRILWLDGLEEGKNRGYECGSHNRKIYIHGTNFESKIGSPASGGCLLLTNVDMLALFNEVPAESHVLID